MTSALKTQPDEGILAQFQPGVTLKVLAPQKDKLSDEHRPHDYLTIVERKGAGFVGRLLHKAHLHPRMTSFVAMQDPTHLERIYIVIADHQFRIFEGIASEDEMRKQVRIQVVRQQQHNGQMAAEIALNERLGPKFSEYYGRYL